MAGKLFGNAIQIFDDLYQNQEAHDDDGPNQGDNMGDIGELRDARKTNAKNRGGNVDKAIKNAHTAFGLNPDGHGGKGKSTMTSGGCRNCQSPSHWWRDCANLLQKKTVFGKSVGKGGKSHKSPEGKHSGKPLICLMWAMCLSERLGKVPM